MLCENPYMNGIMPCSCGQCDPCRNRRKKLWAGRIMLESFKHAYSSFITLTYADKYLPKDGSLNPKDLQRWLKRLRFAVEPRRLRFYAAGEYGDTTWRPHYHAVVFGLSPLEVNTVRTTWDMGHVVVGDLTIQSAAYVAGYVTKKMSNRKDVRLDGKHPEFQRMSLRPGVGALAVGDIAKVLYPHMDSQADVPLSLNSGGSKINLGRYLRSKLREALGNEKETPKTVLEQYKWQLHRVFKIHGFDKKTTSGKENLRRFKNFILDTFSQDRLNYNTKNKIFQGAKTI